MNVIEAIEKRRAFRSLESVEITGEMINDLAKSASLMASCYNKQPWRYIFAKNDPNLTRLKEEALNPGNKWAKRASMIIAVFSKPDLDCQIRGEQDREYFLFDTGMGTASLILRATEMGLVAHPIAGYDPQKVKEILNIPAEFLVITLIIVGKKNPELHPEFQPWQKEAELARPERKEFREFAAIDQFQF